MQMAAKWPFGFHELIAHAATTRDLVAGKAIIGSGTVMLITDYAEGWLKLYFRAACDRNYQRRKAENWLHGLR